MRCTSARHDLIPDRIEAGTYAIAAAITGGRSRFSAPISSILAPSVRFWKMPAFRSGRPTAGSWSSAPARCAPSTSTTEPYPGFPTDLQAQFMALMTVASGASVIRETVFESRFMHVPELVRLGANISLQGSTALVRGVERLHGAEVMATDLRASVSLVLAALVAEGETTVHRIYHLDRGYEFARPQAGAVRRRHPAGLRMTRGNLRYSSALTAAAPAAAPASRTRTDVLLGTGIAGPAALRLGVDRALAEVEKACRAALEEARLGADALSSLHAAVGLAGVGRKGALEAA